MHEGKRGVIDLVSNTTRKRRTARRQHCANTTAMRVPHAGAWLCPGALGCGASAAIASRSWRGQQQRYRPPRTKLVQAWPHCVHIQPAHTARYKQCQCMSANARAPKRHGCHSAAHVATWHLKMGTAQRGKASGRPKARSTACRSSEKAIAHTSSVVRTWCAGRDVASALRAVGGWGARAACNHAKPRKHTRWRAAPRPGRRGVVSASNLHGSRQQHTQQTVKSKMWWRGQGWGLCMRGGRGAVTRTVA